VALGALVKRTSVAPPLPGGSNRISVSTGGDSVTA
jgi:hypothetical protein